MRAGVIEEAPAFLLRYSPECVEGGLSEVEVYGNEPLSWRFDPSLF
jgi:hypothetical protein